jgi:hypothetical protein
VLFSTANLNQLAGLLSQIGNIIGPSSDFIIKVDTDEFLQVYNEKERALSTSLVHDYLKGFATNVTHVLRQAGGNFIVGYVQGSVPSRKVCTHSVASSITTFPLNKIRDAGMYKAVYNSNRLFENRISLGGHAFGGPKFGMHSDLSFLHFHSRCFQHEVENSKKALVSHEYISATDDNEKALTKCRRRMNVTDFCDGRNLQHYGASSHKVLFYAKYLQCPNATEEKFYPGQDPTKETQNNEFRDFLQMTEGKHAVFRIG